MTLVGEGMTHCADSSPAERDGSPTFIQCALPSIHALDYNLALARGPRPCLENSKSDGLGFCLKKKCKNKKEESCDFISLIATLLDLLKSSCEVCPTPVRLKVI